MLSVGMLPVTLVIFTNVIVHTVVRNLRWMCVDVFSGLTSENVPSIKTYITNL